MPEYSTREHPMLVLEAPIVHTETIEDLEEALRVLYLPQGHTVDEESNVFSPSGVFVGVIVAGRSNSTSPIPTLCCEQHMIKDKTRWHMRHCLTCELRTTHCCKQC